MRRRARGWRIAVAKEGAGPLEWAGEEVCAHFLLILEGRVMREEELDRETELGCEVPESMGGTATQVNSRLDRPLPLQDLHPLNQA